MTIWGYARVSTADQDPAAQIEALRLAGVDDEHLVVEHVSGAKTARPGLDTMLAQLRSGDVVTVTKLDRLGRSLSHLVNLVASLGDRGVEFRSLGRRSTRRRPRADCCSTSWPRSPNLSVS